MIKKYFVAINVFISVILLSIVNGCTKSSEAITDSLSKPKVTTKLIGSITQTSAITGGTVSDDGGSEIVARGVCWSIFPNPTTDDEKTNDNQGIGEFLSEITALTPGTTYYVKAYATNNQETGYGEELSFETKITNSSEFTDSRDGQVYTFAQIGTQVWMTQNLNFEMENSWCYNNDAENCKIYGRLYDWNAAIAAVPQGWHLPSTDEWNTLINYLGDLYVAGGKMKESGLIHWSSPNTDADNSSNFTGLPGGYRFSFGGYVNKWLIGAWWSSSENDPSTAYTRELHHNSSYVSIFSRGKSTALSVRCIKD